MLIILGNQNITGQQIPKPFNNNYLSHNLATTGNANPNNGRFAEKAA